MNKRAIRDGIKLFHAVAFCWLYIPHFIATVVIYLFTSKLLRGIISDIETNKAKLNIRLNNYIALLWLLHNDSYYRSLFYYRIGPVLATSIFNSHTQRK